jgi:predicted porin
MKKHLIAAAVAGALAVPAMAQVKVSGTMDVGILNQDKATSESATPVTTKVSETGNMSLNGTTEIVFSGSEDLGGGLKAGFKLAQGMDNAVAKARDHFISLSGGFGGVRVGRFSPSLEGNFAKFAGTITTNTRGSVDSDSSIWTARTAAGDFGRQNSVIEYSSPKFAGATLKAAYANRKTDTSNNSTETEATGTDFSVGYSAGPIAGFISIASREEVNSLTSKDKTDMNAVGLSYNFGMASVTVAHSTMKAKENGVQTHKGHLTGYGVKVPMGAITFQLSAYSGEDKKAGGTDGKEKLKGHQFGVLYALSKRTTVYAIQGLNQDDDADVAGKDKDEEYSIGITHKF